MLIKILKTKGKMEGVYTRRGLLERRGNKNPGIIFFKAK